MKWRTFRSGARAYEGEKRLEHYSSYAKQKALVATLAFGVFGGITAATMVHDWGTAWPLVFFYAVLVVNTYFSVRVFSTITPQHNSSQKRIDFVAVILYLCLATQFENPLNFTALASMLFLACIIKYTLLTDVIPNHRKFLRRKIILDWLGVLLCILAVIGVAANYSHITTIFFAFTNALANIYLLIIKPFYVLSK